MEFFVHLLAEVARLHEALHQLADDVFGVGGAAAVAADDELAALVVALAQGGDGGAYIAAAGFERGIVRDEGIDDGVGRCFNHATFTP